ncbi:beta-N-acetylhexosaminidase [Streptacidiphilus sp. N1-12]|uniref:Beta-N-acetylhexosaminidase n=2 Tax=Streptacidiphilus alkalitolerans TaxID=3342712 RepID=A0ABV6V2Z1_9ACTN
MIIPRPAAVERHAGRFTLDQGVRLSVGPGAERPAALLREYFGVQNETGDDTGGDTAGVDTTAPTSTIRLALVPNQAGGPEQYTLTVRPESVTLTAPTAAGLFHGVQTLRQLLEDEHHWPALTLTDHPLLPWRGFMLDVCRHFMPLPYLRQLVDRIAFHKLNVLHLHLTDDQGWRMEIEGHPRLTEVGAWRTESMVGPAGSTRYDGVPHGGYYTQRELRDLVEYAADRGVTVVPEIEMPGHVRALLAAYPELGNHPEHPQPVWTGWGVSEDILGVSDAALDLCREVLDQVRQVFPSEYIHIGGEECPTVQWERSPAAQDRARELGLAEPAELRSWFLKEMRDFLATRGRRSICWDESGHAVGSLPRDITVLPWRDAAHGAEAVQRGHRVIMAPHRFTYLDYQQHDHPEEPPGQPGYRVTLADIHAFDPLDGGLPVSDGDSPGVLGAQAQLWTEFAPTPAHVDYLLFPRLCAFAEVAWSGNGDYTEFLGRLQPHYARLRALGIRPAAVEWTERPELAGRMQR